MDTNQGHHNEEATMYQRKISCILKNIVIIFLVFFTGFIGTIVVMSKRVNDLTETIIQAQVEMSDSISFFGLEAVKFVCIEKDGGLSIEIIKSNLYNYLPFISGIVLLILSLLLTLIIKRIMQKNK